MVSAYSRLVSQSTGLTVSRNGAYRHNDSQKDTTMTLRSCHRFPCVETAALLFFCATVAAASDRSSTLIGDENRQPGARDWQLTRVRPDNDGFRSPVDRRLLLEAKCAGGRVDRHHGLDKPAAEIPDRDLPHGLLRRERGAARSGRRSARRQRPAGSRTRCQRTCTSAGGSRRSI